MTTKKEQYIAAINARAIELLFSLYDEAGMSLRDVRTYIEDLYVTVGLTRNGGKLGRTRDALCITSDKLHYVMLRAEKAHRILPDEYAHMDCQGDDRC